MDILKITIKLLWVVPHSNHKDGGECFFCDGLWSETVLHLSLQHDGLQALTILNLERSLMFILLSSNPVNTTELFDYIIYSNMVYIYGK